MRRTVSYVWYAFQCFNLTVWNCGLYLNATSEVLLSKIHPKIHPKIHQRIPKIHQRIPKIHQRIPMICQIDGVDARIWIIVFIILPWIIDARSQDLTLILSMLWQRMWGSFLQVLILFYVYTHIIYIYIYIYIYAHISYMYYLALIICYMCKKRISS